MAWCGIPIRDAAMVVDSHPQQWPPNVIFHDLRFRDPTGLFTVALLVLELAFLACFIAIATLRALAPIQRGAMVVRDERTRLPPLEKDSCE